MKDITKTLSLNDNTDYGLCFACGPRNSSGLQLLFERDGDRVTTTYQAMERHQGFPGYLHGGTISTLLDEAMSRVSLLDNRWTITARMEVKFKHPIRICDRVKVVAEKLRETRGFLETRGWVEQADGNVAAEASGKFVFLSEEYLMRMSSEYPGLADEWGMGVDPRN